VLFSELIGQIKGLTETSRLAGNCVLLFCILVHFF